MSIGSEPISSGPIAGSAASIVGASGVYNVALVETIALEAVTLLGKEYPVVTTDTVSLESTLYDARGFAVTLAEVLGFAPTLAPTYGVLMVDTVGMSDDALPNHYANMTLADALQLTSTLLAGIPITATDAIGLAATLDVQWLVELLEEIGLAGVLAGDALYNLTVAETIGLVDSLRQFIDGTLVDSIGLEPSVTVKLTAYETLVETLGLTDTIAPQFLLSAIVEEGIGLSDADIVQMLFSPTLVDGIQLTAGYLEPNGSLTAWAMNARNRAVTEYTNYNFNSFAQLGNRYIAASESGLYELLGEDDDGSDIVARIKSGYMQFGGTHLSRLAAAYIAARSDNSFVLKIITGDGATYTYEATTRSLRSSKVHMGKGQRARYFAFELTGTGPDFDLDTLEFVPIMLSRRV